MNMINNIKIKYKLPVIIVAIAITAAAVIGFALYSQAKSAIRLETEQKLEALAANREVQLADYLKSIEEDLVTVADNPFTLEALRAFSDGWAQIPFARTQTLQDLYIHNNPNPLGEKENLDFAKDGSAYSQAHAKYHTWFRSFLRARGYYDVFLFDMEGNLVYTVFKELDYATNLNTGECKDTDLGHAFRAGRDAAKRGTVSFFDFKPYAPSHGAPASFISTPIVNDRGFTEGVLVFQMPIERLNSIMQQTAGMGETGETYIVGDDYFMRSDSRFSEDSTILKLKVETDSVKAALAGDSGIQSVTDYRGITVVSAYRPLSFNGTSWAIMAEVDEGEMLAPVTKMLHAMLIELSIEVIVFIGIGYAVGRMISRPLTKITTLMSKLANGDVSIKISEIDREDEIGEMAKALQIFKDNEIEKRKLAAEQEKTNEEKLARANKVQSLIADFDAKAAELLSSLSAAAEEMEATSKSMNELSNTTTQQATMVASAATQADANVSNVASAAEEMNASIQTIAGQVAQSTENSKVAANSVGATKETVGRLNASVSRIDEVVTLINGIAEQTNMLALNATIEAARAGEAGKGFAVVANEVKSLAGETRKATEEIANVLESVQKETRDAVGAIDEVSRIIDELSDTALSIATAMDQQSAATEEISRNVQEASAGTNEVTQSITEVSDAARKSGQSAGEVLEVAQQLAQRSDEMKTEIETFLKSIREA